MQRTSSLSASILLLAILLLNGCSGSVPAPAPKASPSARTPERDSSAAPAVIPSASPIVSPLPSPSASPSPTPTPVEISRPAPLSPLTPVQPRLLPVPPSSPIPPPVAIPPRQNPAPPLSQPTTTEPVPVAPVPVVEPELKPEPPAPDADSIALASPLALPNTGLQFAYTDHEEAPEPNRIRFHLSSDGRFARADAKLDLGEIATLVSPVQLSQLLLDASKETYREKKLLERGDSAWLILKRDQFDESNRYQTAGRKIARFTLRLNQRSPVGIRHVTIHRFSYPTPTESSTEAETRVQAFYRAMDSELPAMKKDLLGVAAQYPSLASTLNRLEGNRYSSLQLKKPAPPKAPAPSVRMPPENRCFNVQVIVARDRDEWSRRRRALLQNHPDLDQDNYFRMPNYFTRVGKCLTYAGANALLNRLLKAHENYGGPMLVLESRPESK